MTGVGWIKFHLLFLLYPLAQRPERRWTCFSNFWKPIWPPIFAFKHADVSCLCAWNWTVKISISQLAEKSKKPIVDYWHKKNWTVETTNFSKSIWHIKIVLTCESNVNRVKMCKSSIRVHSIWTPLMDIEKTFCCSIFVAQFRLANKQNIYFRKKNRLTTRPLTLFSNSVKHNHKI